MAGSTTLKGAEIAECKRLRSLRETLGISTSRFAVILGMSRTALTERENERARWRPGEIAHVKQAVQNHLFVVAQALETLPD